MKRSKFTEQQIVGVLKQAEAGVPVKDLCRKKFLCKICRGTVMLEPT